MVAATGHNTGTMGGRKNLATLNRTDRTLVDAGTAFGRKQGLDTGWGIVFGDGRRFILDPASDSLKRKKGSLGLGGLQPDVLSRLNRMQLAMDMPLEIASAHRSKAYNDALYRAKGQRPTTRSTSGATPSI